MILTVGCMEMSNRQYRTKLAMYDQSPQFWQSAIWIIVIFTIGVFFSSLLTGCAEIRKLTYPANFTYIEKKDLDSSMHKMSVSLARLDTLVSAASPASQESQKDIIQELNELKGIASAIRGKGEVTNHLVIDDHIEDFISDIVNAKLFAGDTPPNYYYAGKLAGSCIGCHQFR